MANKNAMTKKDQDRLFQVAIIAAGYFLVITPILEKLGIKKSSVDKSIDKAITDPGSIWGVKYWNQSSAKLIKVADVYKFWSELQSCFGYFNDDENEVYAVFKKYIKYKTQLSWVSYVLNRDKNIELLRWLQGDAYPNDRLSNEEIQILMDWANNLPIK